MKDIISRNQGTHTPQQSQSVGPQSYIRINTEQGAGFVLNQIDMEMDDIERQTDSNEMVEEIICTLANISNDFDLHHELIVNGYIEVVKKFVEQFLKTAKVINDSGINELEEGIQLSVMPTGSL